MAARLDDGDALSKSFLFHEAQRSGALPSGNRIHWRWDSALSDASFRWDANNNGVIDAGDSMKYAYPMASAISMLHWEALQYGAGYSGVGQLDEAMDAIRWGADWLLKAHETSGSGIARQTVRFWAQVGRTDRDHSAWVDDKRIALPRPAYVLDANHSRNPHHAAAHLNLNPASSQPVTVSYATADNTALAGLNSVASSGTLTFDPSLTSRTITIGILNDALNEAEEAFRLQLSNPGNAQLDSASATITLSDANGALSGNQALGVNAARPRWPAPTWS